VLVADIVREHARERGRMATIAEIGLRRELQKQAIAAVGLGAGHGDGAPRWRLVAGIQRSY
jgi:hypothetical protein